jgi:hypothetical protein
MIEKSGKDKQTGSGPAANIASMRIWRSFMQIKQIEIDAQQKQHERTADSEESWHR